MSSNNSTSGLVLLCDEQGVIQEIIHNSLSDSLDTLIGRSIIQLVPTPGMEKALNFLVELRTMGAVFDWELNMQVGDELKSLHVSGVATANELLIMAGLSKQGVDRLYKGLMEINNEQLNALRSTMKAHSQVVSSQRDEETDYYDELSALNNKLANLQRELAQKNAKLEWLNRQKDQFLGMASHDLRTPLGAIISYSEFLMDETEALLSAEHREFLSIIRSSSEFMLNLVEDLLDVSAIESGKLELDLQPVNPTTLVKSNITLNQVLAVRKRIELVLDSPEHLPTVLADSHKIEQVLNNLIGNAVKFSYPDTTVTVSLHQQEDVIQLSVKDSGQGIPAHELDRLFQPFATTSVKSTAGEKSTGLGLMIARKVIEKHQGQIWVESTPGQGSTFFFTLPVAQAVSGPVDGDFSGTETTETAAGATSKPWRILVAEDSPINQKVAVLLLKKLGYQADAVLDGAAAVAALKKQPYDLILMDMHMPEMDGLTAARLIRQQGAANEQPVIIALTASTRPEDQQQCFEAGMNDYLSKPLRREELVNKLTLWQGFGKAVPALETVPGPADHPESPATLPTLDGQKLAELRDILGEQAAVQLPQLITLFLNKISQQLVEMQHAVQQQDAPGLQSAAHMLRAGTGQLGAARLANLCAELEIIGRNNQLDQAAKKLEAFELEFEQVKLALSVEISRETA